MPYLVSTPPNSSLSFAFITSGGTFVGSSSSTSSTSLIFIPLEKHRKVAIVYLPGRLTIGVPPSLPDGAMQPSTPKTLLGMLTLLAAFSFFAAYFLS